MKIDKSRRNLFNTVAPGCVESKDEMHEIGFFNSEFILEGLNLLEDPEGEDIRVVFFKSPKSGLNTLGLQNYPPKNEGRFILISPRTDPARDERQPEEMNDVRKQIVWRKCLKCNYHTVKAVCPKCGRKTAQRWT